MNFREETSEYLFRNFRVFFELRFEWLQPIWKLISSTNKNMISHMKHLPTVLHATKVFNIQIGKFGFPLETSPGNENNLVHRTACKCKIPKPILEYLAALRCQSIGSGGISLFWFFQKANLSSVQIAYLFGLFAYSREL